MGNELSQHLEQSKKTGILQLRNFKLAKVPPEVFPITQFLRNLDLSTNKLISLPPELFINTKSLKNLNLSQNKLETVPNEIGQIVKLESLNLSNNLLTNLPPSVNQLKCLKQVNLSKNKLNKIPVGLCQITQLDHIDLSLNQIEVISDAVETLNCIEINLNENRIKIISDKLAKCPRLKVVRLEQNVLEINAIPKSLLTESKVSSLHLEGNLFTPKQFESLEGYDKYLERYTATKRKFD